MSMRDNSPQGQRNRQKLIEEAMENWRKEQKKDAPYIKVKEGKLLVSDMNPVFSTSLSLTTFNRAMEAFDQSFVEVGNPEYVRGYLIAGDWSQLKDGLYPISGLQFEVRWHNPCIKLGRCNIADKDNKNNCAQLHRNRCQEERRVAILSLKQEQKPEGDPLKEPLKIGDEIELQTDENTIEKVTIVGITPHPEVKNSFYYEFSNGAVCRDIRLGLTKQEQPQKAVEPSEEKEGLVPDLHFETLPDGTCVITVKGKNMHGHTFLRQSVGVDPSVFSAIQKKFETQASRIKALEEQLAFEIRVAKAQTEIAKGLAQENDAIEKQLETALIYVLEAVKHGIQDEHGYVLTISHYLEEAKKIADQHCQDRGGKYSVIVHEFNPADRITVEDTCRDQKTEVYRAKGRFDNPDYHKAWIKNKIHPKTLTKEQIVTAIREELQNTNKLIGINEGVLTDNDYTFIGIVVSALERYQEQKGAKEVPQTQQPT